MTFACSLLRLSGWVHPSHHFDNSKESNLLKKVYNLLVGSPFRASMSDIQHPVVSTTIKTAFALALTAFAFADMAYSQAPSVVFGTDSRGQFAFRSRVDGFGANYVPLQANLRRIEAIDYDESGTTLYGIDGDTLEILTIDQTTGSAIPTGVSVSGLTGAGGVTALTCDTAGNWYLAYARGLDQEWDLYFGDIQSGVFATTVMTGLGAYALAMSADDRGVLYFITRNYNTDRTSFLSIDPVSGSTSMIVYDFRMPDTPFLRLSRPQGLDFDWSTGTLYFLRNQNNRSSFGEIDWYTGVVNSNIPGDAGPLSDKFIAIRAPAPGPARFIGVPGDFSSIQAAIDDARNGDIIQVDTGTYFENIDLLGKRIVIEGVGAQRPTIDGGGQGTVVYCRNGETELTVLRNLRIQNGGDNGLRCIESNPTVELCEFLDNVGFNGGAVRVSGPNSPGRSMLFSNCLFARNEALSDGGAISTSNMDLELEGCTLVANVCPPPFGGAIYGWESVVDVRGSIIWSNGLDDITMLGSGSECRIEHSIVQGGWTGNGAGQSFGVLDADPLFVNAMGDYRLRRGSPAIDRGTVFGQIDVDLDLQPRTFDYPNVPNTGYGQGTDLGAYEFNDSIGTSFCVAAPNSVSAQGSSIIATGSWQLSSNDLTLVASDLPANQFGFFLVSPDQGFVPGLNGNSNGNLCLGGSIGRFIASGQVLSSGASGFFNLPVDVNAIPQGPGTVSIGPGQTWNFQAWYRDTVGVGSNLTDGVEVLFF